MPYTYYVEHYIICTKGYNFKTLVFLLKNKEKDNFINKYILFKNPELKEDVVLMNRLKSSATKI